MTTTDMTEPVYWTWGQDEGWMTEQRDGRWAVFYKTNAVMTLSAAGILGVGDPEPFWFATKEWADFCVERLISLDAAFGRDSGPGIRLTTTGNLGIGITSTGSKLDVRYRFGANNAKPLITVDDGGLKQIDVPELVAIWWRGTTAYRAWRKLMWGEKA